jgi:hypothetical protein
MTFFFAAIFLFVAGIGFLIGGMSIFVSSNYFKRRQDFFGAVEPPSDSEEKYHFANRYSVALSQTMCGIFAIIGGIIVATST